MAIKLATAHASWSGRVTPNMIAATCMSRLVVDGWSGVSRYNIKLRNSGDSKVAQYVMIEHALALMVLNAAIQKMALPMATTWCATKSGLGE